MPSNYHSANRKLLLEVALAFDDLLDQVIFLGGATTSLLLDDGAQMNVRKTDDVDVIADLVTRAAYYSFSDELRKRGFREDQRDGAPLCRWLVKRNDVDYTVDVMPLDKEVLGFTNRWYRDAIENTSIFDLDDQVSIKLIKPLYFLATKFEAYHGRFEGDYYSRDIEDIVCLLEHRKELAIELFDAPPVLKDYLKSEFQSMLNPEFLNVLPGLVDTPQMASIVKNKIELMVRA